MLDSCIAQSKKDGTYDLPGNFGDIMIGAVHTSDPILAKVFDKIREKLPIKRQDGVKDEDIKWWWNLNDIERRMMIAQDDASKLNSFMTDRKKGMSKEEAAVRVRKYFPIYGDPEDITNASGDDRPLPYELKDRINLYIEKKVKGNTDEYRDEIERSSSFNSLIRKEIKANNI